MLGEALKGERRESLEIFTKVYWPTGPGGPERHRSVAQAHHGVDQRLAARGCRPTTSTSTRPTGTTPRPRSRRRCRRSPTSSARARRSTSASASGPPTRSATGDALAKELGIQLDLEPAAVLDAVAGDRGRGRAGLRASSASRRSSGRPIAQGVLTGKYRPGEPPPAGSRATDEKGGADMIKRFMTDDVLTARAAAAAHRRRGRTDHGAARRRLGPAERQRRRRARRRLASRAGRRERQGRRGEARARADGADRRRRSATSSSGTRAGPRRTRQRSGLPDGHQADCRCEQSGRTRRPHDAVAQGRRGPQGLPAGGGLRPPPGTGDARLGRPLCAGPGPTRGARRRAVPRPARGGGLGRVGGAPEGDTALFAHLRDGVRRTPRGGRPCRAQPPRVAPGHQQGLGLRASRRGGDRPPRRPLRHGRGDEEVGGPGRPAPARLWRAPVRPARRHRGRALRDHPADGRRDRGPRGQAVRRERRASESSSRSPTACARSSCSCAGSCCPCARWSTP